MSALPYADLRGKSVIVTGGASNIGRGLVLAFARYGARILLADRDRKQADQTAADALAAGAERVEVVEADLSDVNDVQRIAATAIDVYGNIGVLVNNVGWQLPSWFRDLELDTIRRTVDLNLMTTILMTQTALPHMIEASAGSVVSIASDAAFGDIRQSVYGAAKAAVISLTKSLAKENGRYGVRFNVVAPGLVTPPDASWVGSGSLWNSAEPVFDERGLAAVLKGIPLRRMSEPDDIAAAVLFFASELSGRQLTGQVLSVSGGYAMPG